MANKAYKNYKGELVTNCPKPEGTCLEPNHLTKKQLSDMRKGGFNIPIFAGDVLPKDVIATSKTLKNMNVGKTTVKGNPALQVSFPGLGNRKIFLIADKGDDFYEADIVIVFFDEEFDGDENYAHQLYEYNIHGQGTIDYRIRKDSKGRLYFVDDVVDSAIEFSKLEKSESLRETFDENLYNTEQIMFDENDKIITDTVLPNLPVEAKSWLVEHASYVDGSKPDYNVSGKNLNYGTVKSIVGEVEEL